jgi:hypothetical protein
MDCLCRSSRRGVSGGKEPSPSLHIVPRRGRRAYGNLPLRVGQARPATSAATGHGRKQSEFPLIVNCLLLDVQMCRLVRREEFLRRVRDMASPLRTERLAQTSLWARRQGFRASVIEPGRLAATILRSVEPGSVAENLGETTQVDDAGNVAAAWCVPGLTGIRPDKITPNPVLLVAPSSTSWTRWGRILDEQRRSRSGPSGTTRRRACTCEHELGPTFKEVTRK